MRQYLIFQILNTSPIKTVRISDDDEDEQDVLGIVSIDKYNSLIGRSNEIRDDILINDFEKAKRLTELWFPKQGKPEPKQEVVHCYGRSGDILRKLKSNPKALASDIAEQFGVTSQYVNQLRSDNGIKGKKGPPIGSGKLDGILLDLRSDCDIAAMARKWNVSEAYIRFLMIEKYGTSSAKKLVNQNSQFVGV